MNVEQRVMSLLANANPAPDEASDVETDAGAYLATLHEWSSEMTQLETQTGSSTTPRSRLRWVLAGGLATLLVVFAAFVAFSDDDSIQPAGPDTLTSSDFVGTWTAASQGTTALFIYFDENGHYALSDSFGAFEERTFETGTWTFDGNEFVFTTDSSSSSCAGTVGRYQARRLDDERILLTPTVPDPCAERQRGNGMGALLSYPLDPQFSDN